MATRNNHIIFLRSRCQRSYQDSYVADMILVLLRGKRKVTVCTPEIDVQSPIFNVEDVDRKLHFLSSWKHLPDSLLGYLNRFCSLLKLMWLVFSLILRPPAPRPRLIITDVNSVAVKILKVFTSYKILYVKHFSNLDFGKKFDSPLAIISSLTLNCSLSCADEIIVHTECLKNILQGYIPRINKTISVLNPCYDTGFWLYEPLDVQSIVPLLPNIYFMFVVFSDFKVTSNLWLVLKAMDFIVRFTDISFNIKVHLVIAGYSKPLSSKEETYFEKLQEISATKIYGGNITFLKQTSILQQKTLIENCTAVINPTHNNVFPGSILMAMNMKKPIISVCSGFAKRVLINEVNGFLLHDNPSMLATLMEELARALQVVGEEVVENAKREFDRHYSFHAYSRQLNQIVDNHLNS